MIQIRKAEERGHADHGWLDSHHTFSFANYFDPRFVSYGPLRVINEDRVAPGEGFGTHPHQDMEIISYVLDGALEHKDSLGTGSIIRPGEVQRMSAGTGVAHSEFNHSKTEQVHFLQIWIIPEKKGIKPSYEQKAFAPADKQGRLKLVASRGGREGSVTIHQDVNLYLSALDKGQSVAHEIASGRHTWIQVARGSVGLKGSGVDYSLKAGDGAAIGEMERIEIVGAASGSEVLLFDLP